MPFTRISLLKGKSPDYLSSISRSLDWALVEAFNTPKNDLFQVFDQHEKGEIVFDRNYLSNAPRSDDFAVFAINTGKPRSKAVKQAFYRRLVELLAVEPGMRKEDVLVIINAASSDDWSFSGGEMWEPVSAAPAPGGLPAQMAIHRLGEAIQGMPADLASGPAWAETLLQSNVDGENNAMRVNMDPGVATNWHTHPRGQLLYVLSGVGLVQREGGEVAELRAGDSVWFGADEKHWHGASPTSAFSYISIQAAENGTMVTWLEPVSK